VSLSLYKLCSEYADLLRAHIAALRFLADTSQGRGFDSTAAFHREQKSCSHLRCGLFHKWPIPTRNLLVTYLVSKRAERDANTERCELLPTVISDVLAVFIGSAIVTKFGWWNPFLLLAEMLVCIGGGLLSTIYPDISGAHWVGYQIFGGIGYSLTSNLVSCF
jgi:hypothetical protein